LEAGYTSKACQRQEGEKYLGGMENDDGFWHDQIVIKGSMA
jgi:hypothetical protein